jgi:GNAT superfamily N-acetyltransferase
MPRQAKPEEAPVLRALVRDAHYMDRLDREPAPMTDDYAARIAAGQAWIEEQDGVPVGALVLEDTDEGLMLDNIAVSAAMRGYGKKLLDFVEAEARRRGHARLALHEREDGREHRDTRGSAMPRRTAPSSPDIAASSWKSASHEALLITNARLLDPASGLDATGSCWSRTGGSPSLKGNRRRRGRRHAGRGRRLPLPRPRRHARQHRRARRRAPRDHRLRRPGRGGRRHHHHRALPDTEPALDDPALVEFVIRRGEATGSLTLLPYAAATKALRGQGPLRIRPAARGRRHRLQRWHPRHRQCPHHAAGALLRPRLRRMIVQHPEEPSLAGRRLRHRGRAGHPPRPARHPPAAEAMMVARDIALARSPRAMCISAMSAPAPRWT